MAEPPKIKGHFIINVAEASGKNKEDQLVWDPNFVEGFVKGTVNIKWSFEGVTIRKSFYATVLSDFFGWSLQLKFVEGPRTSRYLTLLRHDKAWRTGHLYIVCAIHC